MLKSFFKYTLVNEYEIIILLLNFRSLNCYASLIQCKIPKSYDIMVSKCQLVYRQISKDNFSDNLDNFFVLLNKIDS